MLQLHVPMVFIGAQDFCPCPQASSYQFWSWTSAAGCIQSLGLLCFHLFTVNGCLVSLLRLFCFIMISFFGPRPIGKSGFPMKAPPLVGPLVYQGSTECLGLKKCETYHSLGSALWVVRSLNRLTDLWPIHYFSNFCFKFGIGVHEIWNMFFKFNNISCALFSGVFPRITVP